MEVASSLPWTDELYADYCEPIGISSMLDAGIVHEGSLVGPVFYWSTLVRCENGPRMIVTSRLLWLTLSPVDFPPEPQLRN